LQNLHLQLQRVVIAHIAMAGPLLPDLNVINAYFRHLVGRSFKSEKSSKPADDMTESAELILSSHLIK